MDLLLKACRNVPVRVKVVDGTNNQVSNLVRHLAWQQTWPVARRRRNDVCHKSKFTTMTTTTVTSRRSVSHLPRYARTHRQTHNPKTMPPAASTGQAEA